MEEFRELRPNISFSSNEFDQEEYKSLIVFRGQAGQVCEIIDVVQHDHQNQAGEKRVPNQDGKVDQPRQDPIEERCELVFDVDVLGGGDFNFCHSERLSIFIASSRIEFT
jgi:hypothetical protein